MRSILVLGEFEAERQAAYRELFRPQLDDEAISDIRMALGQGQPQGDSRFLHSIKRATGQRREARSRGRPRKQVLQDIGEQEQLFSGK